VDIDTELGLETRPEESRKGDEGKLLRILSLRTKTGAKTGIQETELSDSKNDKGHLFRRARRFKWGKRRYRNVSPEKGDVFWRTITIGEIEALRDRDTKRKRALSEKKQRERPSTLCYKDKWHFVRPLPFITGTGKGKGWLPALAKDRGVSATPGT